MLTWLALTMGGNSQRAPGDLQFPKPFSSKIARLLFIFVLDLSVFICLLLPLALNYLKLNSDFVHNAETGHPELGDGSSLLFLIISPRKHQIFSLCIYIAANASFEKHFCKLQIHFYVFFTFSMFI